MAELFGGGTTKIRNRNTTSVVLLLRFQLKLEEEEEQGLSLDPPRNHHHHYHGGQELEINSSSSRHVREEEEEAKQRQQEAEQGLITYQNQFLQQDQNFLYATTQLQQQQQEYATREMGEQSHQQQQQPTPATTKKPSRLGMRRNSGAATGGGEIVEVQGGHIVRSTGRKDRHSKVCTAKGPRDRRVRLSAHTAIQFYDVQDRLGYDRPSKAVDWLMKKAKPSIDELAELPAWTPTAVCATTTTKKRSAQLEQQQRQQMNEETEFREFQMMDNIGGSGSSNSRRASDVQPQNNQSSSSSLPLSLVSDSIADTIKSFFPTGATTEAQGQFQGYAAAPPDLLSRTSSRSQDLRLSLQSFQEPTMLLHNRPSPSPQHHHQNEQQQHVQLFSGASHGNNNTHLGFLSDVSSWAQTEQHHQNAALQRMVVAWNGGGADTGGGDGGTGIGGNVGFIFNSLPQTQTQPAPAPMLQPLFGQNQFFSTQRGPLQSSNMPSVRAWIDPVAAVAIASAAESSQHHHHLSSIHHHHHPSAFSGIGFANTGGSFSGFQIPARIQGDEEEHDGIHNKPSSASSDSTRH